MTGTGLTSHRISWSTVDAIARGTSGPGVVREIRNAERSRTLLLLRAIRDEAAASPQSTGPLPPPESAWQLLDHVQQTAPAALESVLSYPYVAGWAGFTLRRLRRGHPTDPAPAWVHLGHLHGVAAAAALHAGMDVDVRVPARNGTVPLPTLGLARSPAEPEARWSVARVVSRDGTSRVEMDGGTVRLPADLGQDAPGWWALRRLECGEGAHALSVRLDDLDPYRGLYETLDPHRLEDAEVVTWQAMLDEAWHLIRRHLSGRADAMSAGLDAIAPYPFTSRFPLISASSGEAFAGMAVARPHAAEDLAEILVHEFQHILLGGLLRLVPLIRRDEQAEERRFYAPWRDDPRPAAGLLQGVCAFFGVTEFWRAALGSRDDVIADGAAFACARWERPTREAVRTLRADPSLTEAGSRFLQAIEERFSAWEEAPPVTPPHTAALTGNTVAADHRAGWRLRHLRPDPSAVADLARAWQKDPGANTVLRYTETLVPQPDGPWSLARADLLRRTARAGSSSLDPDLAASTGATAADLALAERRWADAMDGYRAELADDPDRPSSWIGLALAWSSLEPGPGAALLLRRPQLVRAVHRRLRAKPGAPQPEALATWLANRLPVGGQVPGRPRTGMA
ncbi:MULTISPECIES: aKG-HExxH-type peptide beta-hydroxylase [unclassified Streptomyces]|uniref:HEXXH motif domain-containing protein n=1 Tax=unclassified Streptomyces TaxID=2593676 RepID=UPI0033E18383